MRPANDDDSTEKDLHVTVPEPTPDTPAAYPAWLSRYLSRNLQLIFYPTKLKGPRDEGWKTRVYTPDEYREGMNVGVKLGTQLSEGRYLVDVDFDWAEGVVLAKRLLPPTGFGFGRESRPFSHAFYTVDVPLSRVQFLDIPPPKGKPGAVVEKRITFVELRGLKDDGTVGFMTMVPPSIHPLGERIQLKADDDITHCPTILRRVTLYAIACILLRHLGTRGLLHDTRLAVSGFLLGLNLTEQEVIDVCEAVAEATGNDISDVAPSVRSTALKSKKKDHILGAGSLIKAIGGDEGKMVVQIIKSYLGVEDFLTNDDLKILANHQENIRRSLRKQQVELYFDKFAQKPMIKNGSGKRETLQDPAIRHYRFETETLFHFLPEKNQWIDVVEHTAFSTPYHPVIDYLSGLTWDGVPRLDSWLITCAAAGDNEYTREVSRIVLMAAVRRVRDPGCKFDEMLVLESGKQGLYKSTALQTLCPDPDWFSDDLPLSLDSREMIERTAGKWIIEAQELSGMSASKVEHLKAMLSRRVDGPARMAYARMPVEVPRQFIIVGTTNLHAYLLDSTGNRRFWPMRVEGMDIDWIREHRDQLWAEAAGREAAGGSIRLPLHLYKDAEVQQERRRTLDPWEEMLTDRFSGDYYRVANDEVWDTLGVSSDRRDAQGARRVANAMQALGFIRAAVKNRAKKMAKGWAKGESNRTDSIKMPFIQEDEERGEE